MITKEEFKKLITDFLTWEKYVNTASDVLKIPNLFESTLCTYEWDLFDTILRILFTTDGVDDINWWIYEKQNDQTLKMYDENDKEIPTSTLDDLWKLIKDTRK